MKVKFANRIYEVLFTKELAGLTMYAVEDEPNHIDWLINVEVIDAEKKELKKIEQKPAEWNEEMGKNCLDAIELLRDYASGVDKNSQLGKKISRAETFLSGLYHSAFYSSTYNMREDLRKAEWSKEDEKEVAVLEAYIRSKDWSERHIDRALGIVCELVNKVKSLRPQNTWKPSDEQMYNLSEAAHYRTEFWDCDILIGLYDELKKLREE